MRRWIHVSLVLIYDEINAMYGTNIPLPGGGN